MCGACNHLLRWDRTDERPTVCPECGATKLRVIRSGVTRIREELEVLVAGTRVVDVDAETADVPAADIVIGTEAALHRGAIRRARPALVAYLDLDQELLAPRYRAASQAHWLVTRGAQLLAARPAPNRACSSKRASPTTPWCRPSSTPSPRASPRPKPNTGARSGIRRSARSPSSPATMHRCSPRSTHCRALDIQATGVQVFGPIDGAALVSAPSPDTLADALEFGLPAGRALGRVRAAVDPPRV